MNGQSRTKFTHKQPKRNNRNRSLRMGKQKETITAVKPSDSNGAKKMKSSRDRHLERMRLRGEWREMNPSCRFLVSGAMDSGLTGPLLFSSLLFFFYCNPVLLLCRILHPLNLSQITRAPPYFCGITWESTIAPFLSFPTPMATFEISPSLRHYMEKEE